MNRESDLNVVLEISDQAESYSDYLYFGENSRELSSSEKNLLGKLADRLEAIRPDEDQKALAAIKTVRGYLKDGYSPIVFCRYIQTAKYLGEAFRKTFSKSVMIEVVTGEMEDELRKEKITAFKDLPGEKILITTDCLSEGINLQDGFNALLHYDLPWNPNRLEQREGRIDRFGQETEKVKVALLYSSNNPMDGVVLDVLLRKAIEIKQAIGISVPFPEDSASVMEAVSKAVFLKSTRVKQSPGQLTIFDDHRIETEKGKVIKALEEAAKKEKERRSIFAQASIRAGDIQTDLDEINEAIGDEKTPEKFVLQALGFLGVQMQQYKAGYRLFTSNLPQRIKNLIPQKDELLISFDSPTPQGFMFIGRNHPFTEQLCHMILNEALQGGSHRAARSAVLRSSAVAIKTVLFQFRVRNVIADLQENRQVVAEEMWLWGYEGEVSQRQFIGKEKALSLLMNLQPTQNMEEAEKVWWLKEETEWIRDENSFRSLTDAVALERADHLVASHTRFKKHVGGNTYKVVEPVLPMDVLGVYILLPEAK